MEFAILTYDKRPMKQGRATKVNIGDPIQTYAMRHIYHKMGITDEKLIKISRYHAKDYDGKYALLPFNCFNRIFNQLGQPYTTLPVSPNIIPVFISFHLHTRGISEEILNQLKLYQPIGCRDEETMTNLRKHGIEAYITGCVTALLPRREQRPLKKKTFFIDVPKEVMKYVPEELKENAEITGHFIPFERMSDGIFMSEEEDKRFYDMGVQQIEKYKAEATLIVTSRLHAAAPCMALGIPVILVSENFDGRFSWIDKYLPLYTPDKYEEIDWDPKAVEYENEKQAIADVIANQIMTRYQQKKDIYSISSFYEDRKRIDYNKRLVEELRKLSICHNDRVKYGLWGLTTQAQTLKNVIEDSFREWKLTAVIDKEVNGYFEGIEVARPSEIEHQDKDTIYFICPESAHEEAKNILDNLGQKYVLLSGNSMKYEM